MIEPSLRAVEFGLWFLVFVATTRPVLRLIFGNMRQLDGIWALIWFGTTNRLLFTGINLFAPDSEGAREFAHVMATLVAASVLAVRYFRVGERV